MHRARTGCCSSTASPSSSAPTTTVRPPPPPCARRATRARKSSRKRTSCVSRRGPKSVRCGAVDERPRCSRPRRQAARRPGRLLRGGTERRPGALCDRGDAVRRRQAGVGGGVQAGPGQAGDPARPRGAARRPDRGRAGGPATAEGGRVLRLPARRAGRRAYGRHRPRPRGYRGSGRGQRRPPARVGAVAAARGSVCAPGRSRDGAHRGGARVRRVRLAVRGPMQIDVFTWVPNAYAWLTEQRPVATVLGGELDLRLFSYRDTTPLRSGQVDDDPYGGGAGMVLRVDVVAAALEAAYGGVPENRVVGLSPEGRQLTQGVVEELAKEERVTVLTSRFEGFDERIVEHLCNDSISIGPYVLSGGELPAMVLVDAIARRLPGALAEGS